MRLKLTIEYDGTGFRGWARQPGERTVEGEVRAALEQIYGGFGALAVAGRTDTGVHALANVVSVEVHGGPPQARTAEALNAALPADIAVLSAEDAAPAFHACWRRDLLRPRYLWPLCRRSAYGSSVARLRRANGAANAAAVVAVIASIVA